MRRRPLALFALLAALLALAIACASDLAPAGGARTQHAEREDAPSSTAAPVGLVTADAAPRSPEPAAPAEPQPDLCAQPRQEAPPPPPPPPPSPTPRPTVTESDSARRNKANAIAEANKTEALHGAVAKGKNEAPDSKLDGDKKAHIDLQPADAPIAGGTFVHAGTNPFIAAAVEPKSTFAIDVDTGSFTLARRFLRQGQLPPDAGVRVEE